jgi:DNA-binding response OmpR family regulator
MRILVIDDEEHLRRVMRITLEAAGYEVADAADGEEGLRLFGDGTRVDATLLDQRMPGMDGLEVLKRMKQIRPDATVIMVTAYATIDLAVDALKFGATDFVRKPMTPETLRHAVAAALAKRSASPAPGAGPSTPPSRATKAPFLSPAEIWTTNGFFIRRVASNEVRADLSPSEYAFVVRRGKEENGSNVIVEIDEATIARVARESKRDLKPTGEFWRRQAETALVNYLWSEAALPADGRLVVDTIGGRTVDEAVTWTAD